MQKPLFWRLRPTERRFILLTGDLAVSLLGLLAALYFWAQRDWLNLSLQFLNERIQPWFYLLPFIWMVLLVELYDVRRASRRRDTLIGVAGAMAVSAILYLIIYFTSDPNSLPRRGVFVFVLTSGVLTLLWRMLYIRIFTAPLFMRRVLVVGAGRAGTTLLQVVKGVWPPPFFVVGLVDDDPDKIGTSLVDTPVLGGSNDLGTIIERENVTDLAFAISGEMTDEMLKAILRATEQGVEVNTMPMLYEELLGRVPILLLQSDWLLRSFIDQSHTSGLYEVGKRLMDLIGGLIGSLGLLVLYPFISLAILLDTGRPVLYTQMRLGKNGRPYRIYKFRTMRQDAEKDGKARPATQNDDRVTRVGRILRKSHLDELPQFFNVLKGEMSLVGPRAERSELVDQLQDQVPFYRARLLVKPGLTGWAQVNFGYAATVEDTTVKLEYDLYYIKHQNLLLDFTILVRTLGTVVGLRGQ